MLGSTSPPPGEGRADSHGDVLDETQQLHPPGRSLRGRRQQVIRSGKLLRLEAGQGRCHPPVDRPAHDKGPRSTPREQNRLQAPGAPHYPPRVARKRVWRKRKSASSAPYLARTIIEPMPWPRSTSRTSSGFPHPACQGEGAVREHAARGTRTHERCGVSHHGAAGQAAEGPVRLRQKHIARSLRCRAPDLDLGRLGQAARAQPVTETRLVSRRFCSGPGHLFPPAAAPALWHVEVGEGRGLPTAGADGARWPRRCHFVLLLLLLLLVHLL